MPTDIEIAQAAQMLPITEIAANLNIPDAALIPYGRYKAKIDMRALGERPRRAKLILVTAINPTPAGEGKTTVSVGLADGLRRLGANAMLALREPSLGPVFGVKGGAAGGGYAQVVPMEDINLHFTGDLHAITAANNLLAAMVDNHIFQGNALGIDPRRVVWRRCMDMNDRQLRNVLDGMGGRSNGMPREDGFDITAASEVMATLCLARDIADLKERLGRLLVAWTFDKRPVYARDINAQGAMTALLKDALMPNLVQTLEHTPRIDTRRAVCQYRAWLQFVHSHRYGDAAVGLHRDRGRFRRGSGRGKVHRYKVPPDRHTARLRGDSGHGARAQEPRRREKARPER